MSQETQYEQGFAPKTTTSEEDKDNLLSDLDFIRVLIVAQKNLHWIFLIFLFGISTSFIYLRYTKSLYQSKSLIKYDIKLVSPMLNQEQMQLDNISHLSGEIELIKSNLIYDKVVTVLPLQISYYAYGRINNTERYLNSPFSLKFFELKDNAFFDRKFNVTIVDKNTFALMYEYGGKETTGNYNFGDIIQTPYFKFIIGKGETFDEEEAEAANKYYFVIHSKEALQRYLSSNLEVKIANAEAKTIEIAFTDHDKNKARDIVATIDSVYMSETLLKKNKAHEQSIAFMNEQLEMTEDNLDEYEKKIEQFTQKNKTSDIKSEFSRYIGKAEIEAQHLEKLNIQLDVVLKLQDAIYKEDGIAKIMPLLYVLEEDKQMQKEANTLFELQEKLHNAMETTKEKTFALKSIKSDISKTRDILIDHLLQYKKLLTDQIAKTQSKLKEYDNAFSSLPSKETEFTKLKRFYDLYEKFYLMLIDRKAEYGISKAGTVPEFLILSHPTVSPQPVYPNTFQVYFIGLSISMVLVFFLVVTQYFLHNTINNVGELERLCVAPILGFIPNFRSEELKYSKLIVQNFLKSPVSEALRSIRTNMEFINKGKNNKVISVTSTISGEGKTFVALNLGGIIAMSGQKVVILDMDLRKPKISKAFEASNNIGISTILIGRTVYSDSIQQTEIPTYYFIASGPVPPNPSELIMSKEFDRLLADLKKEFDVIILDTPPVGIVTDGILVMKKCDLNVYIVRAEYSKKGFERNINNLVSNNKFTNLAVVLNGFDNLRSYAYGYKYGYGQGYGYGDYYHIENGAYKNTFVKKIKKFFKS